jgi:organic hydroperoxide reductase OsmC/OhrA
VKKGHDIAWLVVAENITFHLELTPFTVWRHGNFNYRNYMKIIADVKNYQGVNQVTLRTDDRQHSIHIAPKQTGFGSQTNGGELLFLALATCYCNDLYREAAKRQMKIISLDVTVQGEFEREGEPAKNITYGVKVEAQGSENDIKELLQHTDKVAEIQNTVRAGTSVTLRNVEVVSRDS